MSSEPPEAPPPPPVLPPERPLAPPDPLRTWVWTTLRILLVQLPLTALAVGCVWYSHEVWGEVFAGRSRSLVKALWLTSPAVVLFGLDWLAARRTWRVLRGWEPTPSLGPLVNGAVALGGGGLFIWLVIVKMGEMTRSPNEGATRGELGALRSALSIYYRDMEGVYPEDLPALTVQQKYLTKIPSARTPVYHRESAQVHVGPTPDDSGGWWYFAGAAKGWDPSVLRVNCTHTDIRGSAWTSY